MDCSEGFLKKHALNGSIKGVIKAKKVAELRDACDEHLQHDTTRRVLLDTTRLGRLEHLELEQGRKKAFTKHKRARKASGPAADD